MFVDLLTVLAALFVSLGVGASTLAVVNFFVAIADGTIDENERRMMGVVYKVLRIAMVVLLFLTLSNTVLAYISGATLDTFTTQVWLLVFVLYTNAVLMTLHKMPSSFGPAIQASAWYLLGIISTIRLVDWEFTIYTFVLSYLTLCFFFIALFNLIMMYGKEKQLKKS